MIFAMKKDTWILVLLAVAFGGSLIGAVAVALAGDLGLALGIAAPVVLAVVVIRLLAWPVHYEVLDHALAIRAGIQKLEIPWNRLSQVQPTRSPLSSVAAWSLDRLRVDYLNEKGSPTHILISPLDKEGFVAALAARSQLHKADGACLRPA